MGKECWGKSWMRWKGYNVDGESIMGIGMHSSDTFPRGTPLGRLLESDGVCRNTLGGRAMSQGDLGSCDVSTALRTCVFESALLGKKKNSICHSF